MALDIRQHERESIQILVLKGRLTAGGEVTNLREIVVELAEAGKLNAILDLKEVDFIDSTGLGGLVICYTTLRKADGALKLLNLNKRNVELLVLTKLSTVFELFNDEQDAVNSFFPGRDIKKFDILDFVQESGEGD